MSDRVLYTTLINSLIPNSNEAKKSWFKLLSNFFKSLLKCCEGLHDTFEAVKKKNSMKMEKAFLRIETICGLHVLAC